VERNGEPVFDFDLMHIIPCMLHCDMAIIKKMLRKTAEETDDSPQLKQHWEKIFEELGIRLASTSIGS